MVIRESIIVQIKQEALRHGDRIALIASSRLPEVKKSFETRGIETSPHFNFAPSSEADWTLQSVIIAASRSRRYYVSFDVDGREFKAALPATYADDDTQNAKIEQYLEALLAKEKYHVAPGRKLPLKALAVHAGLGVYGRNNLIYMEGFGSFLNLNVFFTDVQAQDENFFPFGILETCKDCNLCIANCPSGALREESFLVDAPHCLTRVNEGREPFPAWVDPSWHHALVGCERCQDTCPRDRGLFEPVEEIARFNREETEAFLCGELPEKAYEPLGIACYCKCLARNLKSLIAAQKE